MSRNTIHIAPAGPCADTHILILYNPFIPNNLRRFPALVSTFLTLRTVKKPDTSPANSPSLSFTLLITPSLPTPYPVNFSDTHSFRLPSLPSQLLQYPPSEGVILRSFCVCFECNIHWTMKLERVSVTLPTTYVLLYALIPPLRLTPDSLYPVIVNRRRYHVIVNGPLHRPASRASNPEYPTHLTHLSPAIPSILREILRIRGGRRGGWVVGVKSRGPDHTDPLTKFSNFP